MEFTEEQELDQLFNAYINSFRAITELDRFLNNGREQQIYIDLMAVKDYWHNFNMFPEAKKFLLSGIKASYDQFIKYAYGDILLVDKPGCGC